MRCEAPTSPQEPSCVIRYKGLLIRLPWFSGATYLYRSRQEAFQRHWKRSLSHSAPTTWVPQCYWPWQKIQNHSPAPFWLQGAREKSSHMELHLHCQIFFNTQYPLCRDISDAAVAMSLSSVLYGSLLIKCWFRKGLHHRYFIKSGDRGLSNMESFLFTRFLSAPTGLS